MCRWDIRCVVHLLSLFPFECRRQSVFEMLLIQIIHSLKTKTVSKVKNFTSFFSKQRHLFFKLKIEGSVFYIRIFQLFGRLKRSILRHNVKKNKIGAKNKSLRVKHIYFFLGRCTMFSGPVFDTRTQPGSEERRYV